MVNRVLFGPLGGGDYGLKVSRPGYEVTGSIANEELAFDSRWLGAMRFVASGSMSGNNAVQTGSFGRTLPAVPLVMVFIKNTGFYEPHVILNPNWGSGARPVAVVHTNRVDIRTYSGWTFTWLAFLP